MGWVTTVPVNTLREELAVATPLFLAAAAIVFAASVYAAWPTVRRTLAGVMSATDGRWAAALAALAFILAAYVAPHTHRIFFDEDIYEDIGLNIAYRGHAAMANDGVWNYGEFEVRSEEYNKEPNGWPCLLSLAFRLGGPHEDAAFTLTHLLFPLTTFLILICGLLLFGRGPAGWLAALCYLLMPGNALWFSTVAVEPSATCFSVLAVVTGLLALRSRDSRILYMAATATAMAAQFRSEGLLIAGLVGALGIAACRDQQGRWTLNRAAGPVVLFLVLITAHLIHLHVVHNDSWGAGNAPKFAVEYALKNLRANTQYYVDGRRFPLAVTGLFLMGALMLIRRKAGGFLLLWALTLWLPFVFFYAGSYEYGADARFALMSMPALALLAGGAAALLWTRSRGTVRKTLPLLGASALLITVLHELPVMRALTQEAWQCRADHAAALHFATLIPEGGIVLTHNPNMFHLHGVSAAQMFLGENPTYISDVLRPTHQDHIYMHWNYWCNTGSQLYLDFPRHIMKHYETALVEETTIRGQRFALYKIGAEKLGVPKDIPPVVIPGIHLPPGGGQPMDDSTSPAKPAGRR